MSNLDSGDPNSSLKKKLERIIIEIEALEDGTENTHSVTMQETVKRNISDLENLTRSITSLGMFSENEDISEMETDSIRFLLLPALLAFLTGKLTDESRLDVLRREQVYYEDFLSRLRKYGVIKSGGDEESVEKDPDQPAVRLQGIIASSRDRQRKIERFKERQNLQEKLAALRGRAKNGDIIDDHSARELYLTELKLWAAKAADTVETVQQEIMLLRARGGKEDDPTTSTDIGRGAAAQMKPFIITRNAMQKAVYGLGYPSIATVSLEEFFEQKRREGQIQVVDGSDGQNQGPASAEDDQIEREQKEEREDGDLIRRDREYDEYKDDHRRGWGNVHNKG